jgi:hypothetical protein
MKTIKDNPNKTTKDVIDTGLPLPPEAMTVIDETGISIHPEVKVYSALDNQAISRMHTY